MTDALRKVAVKSAMVYEGKATELWVRATKGVIEEGCDLPVG
jgi:hypothetical protein